MFTTEPAPFADYPGAWIIWIINMAAVCTVVAMGAYLTIKKKMMALLPLGLAVAFSYGFRSFLFVAPPEILKAHDTPPLITSNGTVDLIAWGAALTALLILRMVNKPNKAPEPTP